MSSFVASSICLSFYSNLDFKKLEGFVIFYNIAPSPELLPRRQSYGVSALAYGIISWLRLFFIPCNKLFYNVCILDPAKLDCPKDNLYVVSIF